MYRALYRKWRPQVFTDVSGQSHITDTLMNEVASGRLSHAYLFTGSRGTGKTSCAKILSKAVNCLHPVNGNPCNECEICKGIDDGSVLDITEIDAASNNGVDNIRDLREEANFTPAIAKYRVYIIDEVHMLSSGAFNALLKTLEEPPEHVLFILATTEVQKLPATILSRCQRFDFRRIPEEDICSRLKYVAENENLSIDDDAALLIARIADGALRDALSILDQCAGTGEAITVTTVGNAAGLLGKDYLFEISDAVINKDSPAVLNIIDRLHSSSCDMERLMGELVNHFRNIMLAKTAKKPENFIVCTPAELQKYKELAAKLTYGTTLYIMETLCREAGSLKYSSHQRAQVETVLIRLCTPSLSTDAAALAARIDELSAQLNNLKAGGFSVQPSPSLKPTATANTEVTSDASTFMADSQKAAEPKQAEAIEEEKTDFDNDEYGFEEPPLEKSFPIEPESAPVKEAFEEAKTADILAQPKEAITPTVSTAPITAPAAPADSGIVTPSDPSLPFAAWSAVIDQLSVLNKPLYSMLIGSTAYRAGNAIFIKAKNNAFGGLFSASNNAETVAEALRRATGENLKPMLYKETTSPEADEAAEPVDVLLAKLNKLKIDYLIEE